MNLKEFAERGAQAQADVDKILAAHALVGSLVTWVSDDVEEKVMEVLSATADGMVEVEGFSGRFAPHLFTVVVDPPTARKEGS